MAPIGWLPIKPFQKLYKTVTQAKRAYGKQWLKCSSRELRTNSQPQLEVCRPRTSYFKRCFLTSSKKGHPFSGYGSRKAALISWHRSSAGDPSFSIHSLPWATQTHPPLRQHWEVAEQPVQPTAFTGSTCLLWTLKGNDVACDIPDMP